MSFNNFQKQPQQPFYQNQNVAEFAETPKEKEIIRKHLEKMKKI